MRPGAILLNGPSSSGKSTLAAALRQLIRKTRGESCRIVSLDDYLPMSPDEPIEEDDVYAVQPQLCAAVTESLAAGCWLIIDHVMTSERIHRQLMDALSGVSLLTVRVTCSRQALIDRERARGDRCPGSAEASLQYLYPRDGYDLTVDTTSLTANENAGIILSAM